MMLQPGKQNLDTLMDAQLLNKKMMAISSSPQAGSIKKDDFPYLQGWHVWGWHSVGGWLS